MGRWNKSRIQRLINDEIEESSTLEYKAAGSLGKNNDKRTGITKDVSAMANAAGGIIIYGVKEYREPDKKHLPEKIDPINRTEFNKEWWRLSRFCVSGDNQPLSLERRPDYATDQTRTTRRTTEGLQEAG